MTWDDENKHLPGSERRGHANASNYYPKNS